MCHFFYGRVAALQNTAQQSVHPTLGSLARFQAFFYASAFSQSDGVPPPAPARVTQTVGQFLAKHKGSIWKNNIHILTLILAI